MKKHDFESRKEALLKDIQDVMNDVEELYTKGVEAGSEEGKKAKAKLQEKLEAAKERLYRFEDEAGERIRHHADRAREKYDEFEELAEERFKEGKKRFAEFGEEAGDRIKRRTPSRCSRTRQTLLRNGLCCTGRLGRRRLAEPPIIGQTGMPSGHDF